LTDSGRVKKAININSPLRVWVYWEDGKRRVLEQNIAQWSKLTD